MKKFNYLLILCVFTLISVSCENDNEDPSANLDDLPGALVANIDGQSFDFRYQPRAYEGTYQIGDEIYDSISIGGATSVNFTRELDFIIVNPIVGTFELEPSSLSGLYYTHNLQNGSVNMYGSIDGTITVTQLGDRIKGTFNATLINGGNEIAIDGTFDLVISE